MKFLISACAFFLVAQSCWAATGDLYGGLDLDIDQVVWKDPTIATTYPNNASGATLRLGDRIMDDVAVELGYTNSYGSSPYASTAGVDNKLSNRLALREFQLDGFAFLPLGQGWFQPFVTAGIGYDEASARLRTITITTNTNGTSTTNITSTPFFDNSEIDWRAGIGMEFVPADGFSLRFTARYEPYGFGGHMTGGTLLGIGLNASL